MGGKSYTKEVKSMNEKIWKEYGRRTLFDNLRERVMRTVQNDEGFALVEDEVVGDVLLNRIVMARF